MGDGLGRLRDGDALHVRENRQADGEEDDKVAGARRLCIALRDPRHRRDSIAWGRYEGIRTRPSNQFFGSHRTGSLQFLECKICMLLWRAKTDASDVLSILLCGCAG